ncbi:MAG: class I SAM-dependent methyltransferase [Actinomycetota bacterium]
MSLSNADIDDIVSRYRARLAEHGMGPKALGWMKERQTLRLAALLEPHAVAGRTILDVGCGLGDLIPLLQARADGDFRYIGVDLMEEFAQEAERRHGSLPNVEFHCADFLAFEPGHDVDVVLGCGLFNHQLASSDFDAYLDSMLRRATALAGEGFAFDFLSSRVDYEIPAAQHSDPLMILERAYDCSRRVLVRNDYLPFEFSVHVFTQSQIDAQRVAFEVGSVGADFGPDIPAG